MIFIVAKKEGKLYEDTNLENMYQSLKEEKVIGFDLETTGLDVISDTVIMAQIGTVDKVFLIDMRDYSKKELTPLFKLLTASNIQKVGVNIKYDCEIFYSNYGVRTQNLFDCNIVERCLTLNQKREYFSMAKLGAKYLKTNLKSKNYNLFPDIVPDKDIALQFTTLGDAPFTKTQLNYGAYDVIIPLLIAEKQKEALKKDDLVSIAHLENTFLEVLVWMKLNGMKLNIPEWLEIYKKSLRKLAWNEHKLRCWAGLNGFKEFTEINWNSSKQVIPLFNLLNIPIQIKDKKKSKKSKETIYKDSLEESHIKKYKDKFEIVKLYLDYKRSVKKTTSYGLKFLRNVNKKTGLIHSDFYPLLVTGRMSSTPNMQNIPAKGGYRECFIPRNKKGSFFSADFKGQEARILASVSQDRAMLNLFKSKNPDIHSLTASKVFKQFVSSTVNSHLRKKGKTINFAIIYGAGESKIAEFLDVPVEEAAKIISSYFKTYPGLKLYFTKSKTFLRNNGFLITDERTKRKIYEKNYDRFKTLNTFIERTKRYNYTEIVPKEVWSEFYTIKGTMERNAQNYPIQSIASSMIKLAAILIFLKLREKNLLDSILLINIIHDEFLFEITDPKYEQMATKLIIGKMEEAGNKLCPELPFPVDAKILKRWSK